MDDKEKFTLRSPDGARTVVTRRVLMLSQVFWDMLSLGDQSLQHPATAVPVVPVKGRGKKRRRVERDASGAIPVEDDARSLSLLFGLLEGSVKRLDDCNTWELKSIVILADKYDVPAAVNLFSERLWVEVAEDSYDPVWAYAIAMHMKLGSLARHALSRVRKRDSPTRWNLYTVEVLGTAAYYCLIRACDGYDPVDWASAARRLKMPSEWTLSQNGNISLAPTTLA